MLLFLYQVNDPVGGVHTSYATLSRSMPRTFHSVSKLVNEDFFKIVLLPICSLRNFEFESK